MSVNALMDMLIQETKYVKVLIIKKLVCPNECNNCDS